MQQRLIRTIARHSFTDGIASIKRSHVVNRCFTDGQGENLHTPREVDYIQSDDGSKSWDIRSRQSLHEPVPSHHQRLQKICKSLNGTCESSSIEISLR